MQADDRVLRSFPPLLFLFQLQPPAFRLRELIAGWIIALQQMRVGDRWEIYIPAEQGYGRFSQPGIPGGSTLVFDIELLGVG